MKRFSCTKLSAEEVERIVQTPPLRDHPLFTRPARSSALAGKALTLKYDNGETLSYTFRDNSTLEWRDGEGAAETTAYEALDLDGGIHLFFHLIGAVKPLRAMVTVLDFEQSLVTSALSVLGNEFSPREVSRLFMMGYIDPGKAGAVPAKRHEATTEILQRSILWHYGDNLDFQQIYVSRLYSLAFDYNTPMGSMMLPAPGSVLKVNEHTYIHSWIEVERTGRQGFTVMDLRRMKDAGCYFGINHEDKLEFFPFSGTGKLMGQLTNFGLPNGYNTVTEEVAR
jgi:hypothetical protein